MGFLNDLHNLDRHAAVQRLMATGQAGSATLTALRETGAAFDDSATVEMDLTVSLGGGDPYAVTHRQTISRIAIASFQPGATVPVRIDPTDRTSLMIGLPHSAGALRGPGAGGGIRRASRLRTAGALAACFRIGQASTGAQPRSRACGKVAI